MKRLLLLSLLAAPQFARACATCSGPADAPQSQGMNAGILTLFFVLAIVGTLFFAFTAAIALRIARYDAGDEAPPRPHPPTLAGMES